MNQSPRRSQGCPRDNLTGFWVGRYSYDGGIGDAVQFLVLLDEQGGALSGTISEPNSIGLSSRELHAFLSGHRNGADIAFAKTYDGASDAAHRVDYQGRLNSEATEIVGRWTIAPEGGDFTMRRELLDEQEVAEEVALEITPSA